MLPLKKKRICKLNNQSEKIYPSQYSEAVLKEDWIQEDDYPDIINEIEDNAVSNPELGPIFITKDGLFCNLGENKEHSVIFGNKEYDGNNYYELEDYYEIIKANGGNKYEPYPYIDIWTEPNEKQKNAILTWIDYIQSKGKKELQVNMSDKVLDFDLIKEISDDIYKQITKALNESISINEDLLNEATKQQLIYKSKNADAYAKSNRYLGKNRYERRVHSNLSNNVREYNSINMNDFFKKDKLEVKINVRGETGNYVVTMLFDGVLKEISKDVTARNAEKLSFKIVYRALLRAYNNAQIKLDCNCPDFIYRFRYQANKGGYATKYEPRPSDITNPKDSKGAGCKHILLTMTNLSWIMKVSTVINNYIKYCQITPSLQRMYADYIFPKIYKMPYKKAVQLNLFDDGQLPNDRQTMSDVTSIHSANRDEHGRWVAGNKFRFQKKDLEEPKETEDNLGLFNKEETHG